MCKLHADLMMTPGIQMNFQFGKKVHQKEVYLYGLLYNEVVHTLHQAHFLHRHGRCWFVRLLQDSLPEFLRCVRKCLKPVHGNISQNQMW